MSTFYLHDGINDNKGDKLSIDDFMLSIPKEPFVEPSCHIPLPKGLMYPFHRKPFDRTHILRSLCQWFIPLSEKERFGYNYEQC
jgi:hypothetical protein